MLSIPSLTALLAVCFAMPALGAVALFGPERFEVAAKQDFRTTRTFAADAACDTPLSVYELAVTNGAADGTQRVTGGTITLNGTVVVTDAQLRAGGNVVVRVKAAAANTLQIALQGDEKGPGVATVALTRRIDVTAPVRAASTYAQETEKHEQFTETFDVPDLTGPFTIVLVNGPAGTRPADDVSVVLNGVEILSKADIESRGNQDTPQRIEDPVTLLARNTLTIGMKSNKVPAAISVALVRHLQDTTAPVLTIPALQDGVITADATFAFAGTAVDDQTPSGVTVNGTTVAVAAGGTFSGQVPLQPGANAITVAASDCENNTSRLEASVLRDMTAPQIAIFPSSVPYHQSSRVAVSGTATDDIGLAGIAVNGVAAAMNGNHWTAVVDVAAGDGPRQISAVATDKVGRQTTASATVVVDATAPLLQVTSPSSAPTKAFTATIQGSVSDALSGVAVVDCGGAEASVQGGSFTCMVKLALGTNPIQIVATDLAGNAATANVEVTRDSDAPVIAVSAPEPGTTTNAATVEVKGGVADDDQVAEVTVGGNAVSLGANGNFSATVSLANGANAIVVAARDRAGNSSELAIPVTRFTVPTVTIDSPADLAVIRTASVVVRGTVDDPGATVVVNGMPAAVANGAFSADVPLVQGRTVITATATNATGQAGSSSLNIYRDSIPPRVIVNSPEDGATVYASPISVAGAVDDIVVGTINAGQVRVTVNGVPAEVANRGFLARDLSLSPGTNTLTIAAVDQGGNTAVITQTVVLAPAPMQARLVAVSGNGQRAVIGRELAQPVIVRALSSTGEPLANRAVRFEVIENNGTVRSGSQSGRAIEVKTDGQGEASVRWTLGTRAGAGNHRLEVSGDGLGAPIALEAIATTGPAALVVADSGNNQFGIAGEALPRPLVAVAVDAGSNRLANVPVVFSVRSGDGHFDGQQSVTVLTDSDGRAVVRPTLGPLVGPDSNVFIAGAAGASDGTAFVASSRAAGPAAETRISGVVLDNTDLPIAGVSVRVEGTSLFTQTNAQGQFVVNGAPVGYAKLIIDGSTAQRPGSWPMLEFQMYTLSGNDNTVGMPIYLLPIDVRRGITVDEARGGTLTLPELPGFSLTIAPGSATFPGGSRTGTVSVTMVHADKMPMTPGFGQQPRFIVTIQPPGVHFDPPAAITFPNVDGLKPGEVTEMYSFDHDLGQFVAIGTGAVSADGSVLASDPGVGIIKGGWHCGGNPATSGTTHDCPECKKCEGDDCVPDPAANDKPCSDDGAPCTMDICRDGTCTHPSPNVTVTLESPDNFRIQTEPRMPAVIAKAQVTGVTPDPTPTAQFKWVTKIKYVAQNGREIKLDLEPVTGGREHRPSFTAIRGGEMKIKATLLRGSSECDADEKTQTVRGLNPPFGDIRAAMPSATLAQMVCRESSARQFGLTQGMPIQHPEPDGRVGVGLMQVTDNPSDDAFWNWRTNIAEGLATYRQKRTEAERYLNRLQREHPTLPPFTEEQILAETVTRYNGGRYWKHDAATNSWIDKPDFLNPYPACRGLEEGTHQVNGRTVTCRPYYDLVQEASCQ